MNRQQNYGLGETAAAKEVQTATAKQEPEKNIREEMQVMRRQYEEQMAGMETLLTKQRIEHEEQLKIIKEEMEELRRQRIEHEKQLKTIKEEIEELRRQKIEHEAQLKTIKKETEENLKAMKEEMEEEMEEGLAAQRLAFNDQRRTAKEEAEREIEEKIHDIQDRWEKTQAERLLRKP